MIDLWPDEITVHAGLKAPVAILKVQGALLGRKTSNLVVGEVSCPHGKYSQTFEYVFALVAPALGNYHYELLRISHSICFYPLGIKTEEEIVGEISARMKKEDGMLIADSEESFMKILKAIFAAKKTLRVIGAIMAQSESG